MYYRVLSIQSHVAHGYVGNRSAVFPLQVLGIEVDFINSVQFSNHTGYNTVKGQVLNSTDLRNVYEGLKANGLHHYTHVLTGYVGSVSFLETVAEIVKDLKTENPQLKYYCDPVLGDSGELYVPAELIPIYQEKILPLADVILPNQFEAELLTGSKIVDEVSALACIRQLHARYGVPTVVLSSTSVIQSVSASATTTTAVITTTTNTTPETELQRNVMLGYASCRSRTYHQDGDSQPHLSGAGQLNGECHDNEDNFEQVRFRIPLLDGAFRGTGDLFAALTLAHLEAIREKRVSSGSLAIVFEQVISTMQAVLQRTLLMAELDAKTHRSLLQSSAQLELKLIQSLDDIRHPPEGHYVESIGLKI